MEIKGEVQAVRKDGKALQIENNWYQFFKPNKAIQKGDIVKINYTVNKDFNNIKKLDYIEVEPEIKKESKVSNPEKPKLKLDTTTLNTIIMSAKDIKVAHVEMNVPRQFKDIISEILEGIETIKL